MKSHTYDLTERLSQHFTLGEMTYSDTARRLGMLNPISSSAIVEHLRTLCQQVLQPLRQAVCEPVRISSGYRSECLNYVVGGASNSQHCQGEAADIWCSGEEQARYYYDFIRLHLPFDQLLLEHRKKSGAWWVHVSYTTRRALRRDARIMII